MQASLFCPHSRNDDSTNCAGAGESINNTGGASDLGATPAILIGFGTGKVPQLAGTRSRPSHFTHLRSIKQLNKLASKPIFEHGIISYPPPRPVSPFSRAAPQLHNPSHATPSLSRSD